VYSLDTAFWKSYQTRLPYYTWRLTEVFRKIRSQLSKQEC